MYLKQSSNFEKQLYNISGHAKKKKKTYRAPSGKLGEQNCTQKVNKTKSLAVDAEKHSRGTKHFTILFML